MKVKIVCGIGFGDEGKGMVTSSLSTGINTLVIRYGGGQQCGHTVMTKDKKHIFSNFGSGTINGARTYLSKYCTIDPYGIMNEYNVLKNKNINSGMYIDPLTVVTTPYDIYANRKNEEKNNHGSCGVGIGETIKRHEELNYKIYAIDLYHEWVLRQKLNLIKQNLYPDVNINIDYFYDAVKFITHNGNIHIGNVRFEDYENIIFEGHQGIMLDQSFGFFPHVTRSNTTTINAIELIKEFGLPTPEIYYISRAYLTRHGNGPLPNEKELSLINTEHETNGYNKYQKHFRVAPLDFELMERAIYLDQLYSGNICHNFNLVVTCCDQIKDKWYLFRNNLLEEHNEIELYRPHFNIKIDRIIKTYDPYVKKLI